MPADVSTVLEKAVKALVAERRSLLREHCEIDLLRAYHNDELDDERREAIAEHLAVCENCTLLLLHAVIEPGLAGASDAEIGDAEIEAGWKELAPHLKRGPANGRSLASVLSDGSLDGGDALALAAEISRALAALHAEGGVAADLRAENVLISDAGNVRLRGRGFSPSRETLDVGYGGSGEAALSNLYRSLSPEQIVGEEPTPASNVFSLGVVLYELLAGSSPFRGTTPLDTASRILSLEPPAPIELNPALDPDLSELLRQTLDKAPEARPSSTVVTRTIEATLVAQTAAESTAGLDDEIERLYETIAALAEQPDEEGRELTIERCYARLRTLQAAEAEQFLSNFAASLAMGLGAGEEILGRARALREELEDLASHDSAAENGDGSAAPAASRRTRSVG